MIIKKDVRVNPEVHVSYIMKRSLTLNEESVMIKIYGVVMMNKYITFEVKPWNLQKTKEVSAERYQSNHRPEKRKLPHTMNHVYQIVFPALFFASTKHTMVVFIASGCVLCLRQLVKFQGEIFPK